jgi:hypothetical protein
MFELEATMAGAITSPMKARAIRSSCMEQLSSSCGEVLSLRKKHPTSGFSAELEKTKILLIICLVSRQMPLASLEKPQGDVF